MSSTIELHTTNAKDFLDKFDNFIFDCDGVLWRGDHMIEGANSSLDLLSKEVKYPMLVLICRVKMCISLQTIQPPLASSTKKRSPSLE
jgi:hypothetical protein